MSRQLQDLLASKFISRKDVKARQNSNGSWMPVEVGGSWQPWVRNDLSAHISGSKSFGHYMLGLEDTCKLFAFDIDLVKDARPDLNDRTKVPEMVIEGRAYAGSPRDVFIQNIEPVGTLILEMRTVAQGLAATAAREFDLQTAISFSGTKGLHVYCFTGEISADLVRDAGLSVMEGYPNFSATKGNNFFRSKDFPNVEVEVFPKQGSLDGKKLGNLMRLPLGVNSKSDRQSFFIDHMAPADRLEPLDPVSAMSNGIDWDKEA